jgi:hypothetical protein
VADHQLPHPLSLFGGNKVVNQNKNLENLVEMAKVLKKREGHNSAKRLKSWVEKQAKKRNKNTIKDNVGQQFSKAKFLFISFLFFTLVNFPWFINIYVFMPNNVFFFFF